MPAVLLVVTMPALREQAPLFHADALMAYEIAIAAVLLLSFLETRAAWQCVAASILLGGALLTKRDALLFVVCVLVAGFAASLRQRGWAWRGLLTASLVTAAIGSIWWIAQPRIGATTPSGGAQAATVGPGPLLRRPATHVGHGLRFVRVVDGALPRRPCAGTRVGRRREAARRVHGRLHRAVPGRHRRSDSDRAEIRHITQSDREPGRSPRRRTTCRRRSGTAPLARGRVAQRLERARESVFERVSRRRFFGPRPPVTVLEAVAAGSGEAGDRDRGLGAEHARP